jgi:hypothetical protein
MTANRQFMITHDEYFDIIFVKVNDVAGAVMKGLFSKERPRLS